MLGRVLREARVEGGSGAARRRDVRRPDDMDRHTVCDVSVVFVRDTLLE